MVTPRPLIKEGVSLRQEIPTLRQELSRSKGRNKMGERWRKLVEISLDYTAPWLFESYAHAAWTGSLQCIVEWWLDHFSLGLGPSTKCNMKLTCGDRCFVVKMPAGGLLCLLLCCCCVDQTLGSNPGFKIRLSQSALNYAASVGNEKFLANLQTSSFPDRRGIVYGIKYEVKNMKVGWWRLGLK